MSKGLVRRWCRLALGSLLLLLLAIPVAAQDGAPGPGAPFSTSGSGWEGLSEFVRLGQRELGTARVRVVGLLDYGKLTPEDALVIVYPKDGLKVEAVTAFLAAGGRVAIIDDYGESERLLQRFGIHRVPAPLRPAHSLRGDPDLAIATPSTQVVAGAERGRHPMTEKVTQVVTNHPRALKHPDLTPILEIQTEDGEPATVAVTGIIAQKGRLLAVSDASIFINLMLRYPGNRELTRSMFEYLAARDTDDHAKGGKLYVVSGSFLEKGMYGRGESVLDDLKEQVATAQNALEGISEEGLPPTMSLLLATLLGVWVLWPQLKDDLPSLPHPLPGFARPVPAGAQLGLSARAQILSGPVASPLLSIIEMDGALRETLATRLRINSAGGEAVVSEELQSAGLSAGSAQQLAQLLAELRRLGQSLAEGRPERTSPARLQQLHQQSMKLLGEVQSLGKKQ